MTVSDVALSKPNASLKCVACHQMVKLSDLLPVGGATPPPTSREDQTEVMQGQRQANSQSHVAQATEIMDSTPFGAQGHSQQAGAQTAVGWLVVHSENAPTQTYDLRLGTQVVGRKSQSRACEIMIETYDNCISRNHFRITVGSQGGAYSYLVEDTQSTNGTYVDTERLQGYERKLKRLSPGEQVYLQDGSIIQAGRTKIILKTYGSAKGAADATRIVSGAPINKTVIL